MDTRTTEINVDFTGQRLRKLSGKIRVKNDDFNRWYNCKYTMSVGDDFSVLRERRSPFR